MFVYTILNHFIILGHTKSTPVSLSSQFRRVYVSKPDLSPIIQAVMLSFGFGMPKTLTSSLMAVIQTFYKIAPKGLAQLPGLSLVKQVNLWSNLGRLT